MSSLVRRIQKRLLDKSNVALVPVHGRKGRIVGFRHRLCAAHIAYDLDGKPHTAPALKPKRVRKAVIVDTSVAAKPKAVRKPRAKKSEVQANA